MIVKRFVMKSCHHNARDTLNLISTEPCNRETNMQHMIEFVFHVDMALGLHTGHEGQ